MRLLTFSFVIPFAAFLAACGGNVVTGSPTGSGASSGAGAGAASTGAGASTTGPGASTTTGGGGAPPAGDCKTDADCAGGTCAPITPGGWLVCLNPPGEATSCTPMSPMDQCCTSADCTNGGKCYASNDLAMCFGGPAMPLYNECAKDLCASDFACTNSMAAGICALAGAFGQPIRVCLTAYCRTDADCTAHSGGVCAPVSQPCCGYPGGLACVYPGGCSKASECKSGACAIDPTTHTGTCLAGPPPCPV